MAFKTILVRADSERSLPLQLDIAEAISTGVRSHVVGFAAPQFQKDVRGVVPGRHRDAAEKAMRQTDDRLRNAFNMATTGKPLTSEWASWPAADPSSLTRSVTPDLVADVIIIGFPSANRIDAPAADVTAGTLIVETGRPVVLVPNRLLHSTCGRRILVGWNATREATRAVLDALPVLQRAQSVTLLRFDNPDKHREATLSGSALCASLRRHGIRVKSDELAIPQASAGAALLSAIKAENADLLVMGCGGHWRARRLVLGQTTRHVLHHLTVPVLMSH